MKDYLDLLKDIMENGDDRGDRTGTGRRSVFGRQIRFDLREGFPLITTKRVKFKLVVAELLWFLKGDTNISYLQEHGVRFWDDWADENGDLGPVYGHQWRNYGGEVDQITEAIRLIKEDPDSRRIVVSAWNPVDLPEMALAPCHCLFQFYPSGENLDLQLYQRSCDAFIGLPFNIASYSLLLAMVAQVTGRKPRNFVHTFGDLHVYLNHFSQVQKQLERGPRSLPKLFVNPEVGDIYQYTHEDFSLTGYDPHPWIKAPIAV